MAIRSRFSAGGALAAMLLAMGGFSLSSCNKSEPAAEAASVTDASAVAAMVNGQPIYVSDVQLEAEAQDIVDPGKRLEPDSAEFNHVLDQLIDVKLLAIEAETRGLDEEPQSRHRLESAREHILGNILVEAVVDERVDEAAIRKMYEAQIAIWELGEEAHIRHIVQPTKEDIDKVIAELNKGADFAVLASQKSTDEATRMEGGDLGYMTEEEATPEFARVIRNTPNGGISKPFETDMGWHVAKVDDRRKEQPPSLEELRGPIMKHLTMIQIGEVLKELRTKAKIVKQTSPQNSTLDVDPFTLDEEKPSAPATPPPAVVQPPPANASDAPASTVIKPSAEKPIVIKPAPKPGAPKPAETKSPPPAEPEPQGPVSESRPGTTP
jgi:peptidyl-prolyl cis-trans isomerase C